MEEQALARGIFGEICKYDEGWWGVLQNVKIQKTSEG